MNKFSSIPQIASHVTVRLKSVSKGLGVVVIGVGCLVLIGWAFEIAALKGILPGWATMKSMTALLFILSGSALAVQIGDKSRRVVQLCGFVICLTSALTLGEYVFHVDFGIDQMVFRDPATDVLFPGRMAPTTALCFLLIGLAFLFQNNPSLSWHRDALGLAVLAIAMLALIGYLYGVSSLYQIGAYTSMALHTALSFFIVTVGAFLARPEQGLMQTILAETAGGRVLRRFIPIAFSFPIILGWLRLMGQQAGLYDTAFGLAIMVISLITTLTISAWVNAQQLTQADLKRQQTHNNLLESERRLRTTTESMLEGYQIVGFDWRHLYVNNSAVNNTQLSRELLLGRTLMECFPGIEESALFDVLRECMEARTAHQTQIEYTFPNGTQGWFDLSVQPVPDGILILSNDVTERKQAQTALLEEQKLLRTLVENLPNEIYVKDLERRFLLVNELVVSALGAQSMHDVIGKRDEDFLPAEVAGKFVDEEKEILRTGLPIINDEHSPLHKAGPPQWFLRTKLPLRSVEGVIIGLAGFGIDITSRKLVEEQVIQLNIDLEQKVVQRTAELAEANHQLQQLAIMDELTGLYNRRGFMLLAEEQLLLARRALQNLLIFYADLDGLKEINDTLGHKAGDQAILTAAQALSRTFRASDIKARLGGDEFIVLAVEAAGHDLATLQARLQENLDENQQSMSIGAISVGIRDHDTSLEALMASADQAMYAVKMKRPRRSQR